MTERDPWRKSAPLLDRLVGRQHGCCRCINSKRTYGLGVDENRELRSAGQAAQPVTGCKIVPTLQETLPTRPCVVQPTHGRFHSLRGAKSMSSLSQAISEIAPAFGGQLLQPS